MKCVLIGGDWDGGRVDVPEYELTLPMPRKLSDSEFAAAPLGETVQIYRRHTLFSNAGTKLCVFVHGVPGNRIIETLIDGYRMGD